MTAEELERLEGLLKACPHQSGWKWDADHKLVTTEAGGVVLGAAATATCGREGDDYYACQRPRAIAHLTLKDSSAELFVAAVNSLPSLIARARRALELEEALERIRDATPRNTNSGTADQMASWTHAVAATALQEPTP